MLNILPGSNCKASGLMEPFKCLIDTVTLQDMSVMALCDPMKDMRHVTEIVPLFSPALWGEKLY